MPNFNSPHHETDDVTPAPRLVAVRKKAPAQAPSEVEGFDAEDLPVFEGGESLEDEDGFTPEEQSDLEDEMLRFVPGLAQAQAEFEKAEQALQDLDVPSAPTVRHTCPVAPCDWFLEAPAIEVPSVAALMGGVSLAQLEQAREVEQLLTEHLHTHSVMDWLTALRNAQSALDASQVGPPGIRTGYEHSTSAQGPRQEVIPGPKKRDPAREAAVRAVDARLGRSAPPPTDGLDPSTRDELIRQEFQRKRAKTLTPLDTTPRYRADLEPGQVGIKY